MSSPSPAWATHLNTRGMLVTIRRRLSRRSAPNSSSAQVPVCGSRLGVASRRPSGLSATHAAHPVVEAGRNLMGRYSFSAAAGGGPRAKTGLWACSRHALL